MLRRSFLAALGGLAAVDGSWTAPPASPRASLTEIRTYRGCVPGFRDRLESCLAQAGLNAENLLDDGGVLVYSLGFENAEARNAAWARVNTLAGWPAVARGFRGYESGAVTRTSARGLFAESAG